MYLTKRDKGRYLAILKTFLVYNVYDHAVEGAPERAGPPQTPGRRAPSVQSLQKTQGFTLLQKNQHHDTEKFGLSNAQPGCAFQFSHQCEMYSPMSWQKKAPSITLGVTLKLQGKAYHEVCGRGMMT